MLCHSMKKGVDENAESGDIRRYCAVNASRHKGSYRTLSVLTGGDSV